MEDVVTPTHFVHFVGHTDADMSTHSKQALPLGVRGGEQSAAQGPPQHCGIGDGQAEALRYR